jgi:cysteine synthase
MKAIAVEPMEQMLITDAKGGEKIGEQGPHKIQGMGAGLVPKVSRDTAYVLLGTSRYTTLISCVSLDS